MKILDYESDVNGNILLIVYEDEEGNIIVKKEVD